MNDSEISTMKNFVFIFVQFMILFYGLYRGYSDYLSSRITKRFDSDKILDPKIQEIKKLFINTYGNDSLFLHIEKINEAVDLKKENIPQQYKKCNDFDIFTINFDTTATDLKDEQSMCHKNLKINSGFCGNRFCNRLMPRSFLTSHLAYYEGEGEIILCKQNFQEGYWEYLKKCQKIEDMQEEHQENVGVVSIYPFEQTVYNLENRSSLDFDLLIYRNTSQKIERLYNWIEIKDFLRFKSYEVNESFTGLKSYHLTNLIAMRDICIKFLLKNRFYITDFKKIRYNNYVVQMVNNAQDFFESLLEWVFNDDVEVFQFKRYDDKEYLQENYNSSLENKLVSLNSLFKEFDQKPPLVLFTFPKMKNYILFKKYNKNNEKAFKSYKVKICSK